MKDVKIWKMPGLIRMIMISFRNRNTQKYPRFRKIARENWKVTKSLLDIDKNPSCQRNDFL